MAESKVFPKGIFTFKKNDKAPDFVLGAMVINLTDFKEWVNGDGKKYLTDYKGSPQLKLQMTTGKDGKVNISVDTYKKDNQSVSDTEPETASVDDLPF